MKKIISVLIIGLFLVGTSAFANDVTIDSSGNVTTGVNANGNIEVTGASGETGVFSQTSGTGAIAVRGENTSYGSFGTLGGYVNPQDVGVYGYSLGGWAGYFEGTVRITSDLTVDGTITGLDAAYVNEGQSGSVTSLMILDGTILPADVSFNYAGSTTRGGAATDLVCTACVSQTELDFTAGTGDITGVTAGTGLTGGGMSGDVTLGVMVPLTIDGSYAGTIVSGINSGTGYGVLGLRGSFELGNRGYLGHTDYGVYGIGEIGTATGVYGRNLFSGNFGYLGGSLHGVHGESSSGIGGYFTSTTGYGLIVASGNAGFGTLSPAEQLHVWNHMQVGNPASIWASAADNRLIKFGDGEYASIGEYGGDDDLRIKGTPIYLDGNVGIGTSTPSEKLTVAGTIESTIGGIKFPDGSVQTSAKYGGVAVVAKSGGDYTDPLTAMNNVYSGDNWCGTPSATNTCMLKIMPGIYDLGNNGLAMQAYVDIEGSGENVTTITSTHSGGSSSSSATVSGAGNAEIRFLTVENQGGSTYSIAIYNINASPDITNVTATASGGTSNYGVYNRNFSSPAMTNVTATASGGTSSSGVYNYAASSPAMTNVTATASGGTSNYGVLNFSSSSPAMTNVTATASGGTSSYGVYNSSSSSSTIKTSSISGTSYSIFNSVSSAKVGATMLDGSVSIMGFTCVGAYDQNFAALDSVCQ